MLNNAFKLLMQRPLFLLPAKATAVRMKREVGEEF
jgi:hypothetical protein